MKKVLFQGLCTAMVTPFTGDRLNEKMVRSLIEKQIQAGVQAIVLAGTTGESPTLSDQEKKNLFQYGVEAANGKCKIIAGTGSNDTRHAIELSKAAEQCGVDGLLVVTPYYNKATGKGLVKHYKQITDAVQIPVVAYNVPSRTGVDITCEVCRELAMIPNMAGIKEASGNISKIIEIISENGGDLPLWSGNDDQTVPVMSVGGQGVISVISNIAPQITNQMVTAALQGNYETAGMLQRKLKPLCDLMFCQVNPIPIKAAMCMMGTDVGMCRMPLDELSDNNITKMNDYISEHSSDIY